MDAKTFLQNEYGNADNFNSRQLLDSLNAVEQHLLTQLMDKFAAELANGAEQSSSNCNIPLFSNSEAAVCVDVDNGCPKYMEGVKGCEGCEYWQ